MKNNLPNIYLKFFNAQTCVPFDLDEECRVLLGYIGVAHMIGHPFTVMIAMSLGEIASPATLHRKLDRLIEAGYITLEYNGKNRRSKYLMPTPTAEAYFTLMGASIKQAMQGESHE